MNSEYRQPAPVAPRSLKLTPRQRQILRLMCEGKSNKEIANSLDISLGTVKQHAAALFKRMDVHNRSMAVSQGMELVNASTSTDADKQSTQTPLNYSAEESLLVRRPCTTVSFRASPSLNIKQIKRFNHTLAELAGRVDALYVPDDSGGGEVLLGIKTISEWDVLVAVRMVQQARDLARDVLGMSRLVISAAINCGLAVISIDAEGRWLGDTVATPVTSATRKMLSACAPGEVQIGASAIGMLGAFHASPFEAGPVLMPLDRVAEILRFSFEGNIGQNGRADQYQVLSKALTTSDPARIYQLCGQVGIGKTHMCRGIFSQSINLRLPGRYFRSLPGSQFCDATTGMSHSLQTLLDEVKSLDKADRALVIVDDADLLHGDTRAALTDTLVAACQTGIVSIITNQIPEQGELHTIELDRLSTRILEAILASSARLQNQDESELFTASRDANGLPLYALELISSINTDTTLPMLTAIACQIHRKKLSWLLLRNLVKSEAILDPPDQRAVSRAIGAGILIQIGNPSRLVFTTSILRRAVASLAI